MFGDITTHSGGLTCQLRSAQFQLGMSCTPGQACQHPLWGCWQGTLISAGAPPAPPAVPCCYAGAAAAGQAPADQTRPACISQALQSLLAGQPHGHWVPLMAQRKSQAVRRSCMLLELYSAFSHAGRECAAGLARYQQAGGRRVLCWGPLTMGRLGRACRHCMPSHSCCRVAGVRASRLTTCLDTLVTTYRDAASLAAIRDVLHVLKASGLLHLHVGHVMFALSSPILVRPQKPMYQCWSARHLHPAQILQQLGKQRL